MSYITQRGQRYGGVILYNICKSTREQKRCEGRLKRFDSCVDARAWNVNENIRSTFLMDYVNSFPENTSDILAEGDPIALEIGSAPKKNELLETSEQKLEYVVAENNCLRKKLAQCEENLSTCQARLSTFYENIYTTIPTELSNIEDKLQKHNLSFKEQIEIYKNQVNLLNSYRKSKHLLKEQIDSLKCQINENAGNEKKDTSNTLLLNHLTEEESASINQLQQMVTELKTTISNLQPIRKERDSLRNEIKMLNAKIAKIDKNYMKQLNSIKQERGEAGGEGQLTQLLVKLQHTDQLNKERNLLVEQVNYLKSENKNLFNEKRLLQQSVACIASERDMLLAQIQKMQLESTLDSPKSNDTSNMVKELKKQVQTRMNSERNLKKELKKRGSTTMMQKNLIKRLTDLISNMIFEKEHLELSLSDMTLEFNEVASELSLVKEEVKEIKLKATGMPSPSMMTEEHKMQMERKVENISQKTGQTEENVIQNDISVVKNEDNSNLEVCYLLEMLVHNIREKHEENKMLQNVRDGKFNSSVQIPEPNYALSEYDFGNCIRCSRLKKLFDKLKDLENINRNLRKSISGISEDKCKLLDKSVDKRTSAQSEQSIQRIPVDEMNNESKLTKIVEEKDSKENQTISNDSNEEISAGLNQTWMVQKRDSAKIVEQNEHIMLYPLYAIELDKAKRAKVNKNPPDKRTAVKSIEIQTDAHFNRSDAALQIVRKNVAFFGEDKSVETDVKFTDLEASTSETLFVEQANLPIADEPSVFPGGVPVNKDIKVVLDIAQQSREDAHSVQLEPSNPVQLSQIELETYATQTPSVRDVAQNTAKHELKIIGNDSSIVIEEESQIFELMPNRSLLVQVDKNTQIKLDVEEEELTSVFKCAQHEIDATTQTNKEKESQIFELMSNTSLLAQVDKNTQIVIDVEEQEELTSVPNSAQHGINLTTQTHEEKVEESKIYEFMPNRSLVVQVDKDTQIELDVDEEKVKKVPRLAQHKIEGKEIPNRSLLVQVERTEIHEFMPNRSVLVQVDKDTQIELDVEEEELTRVPKPVQDELNATTQTNKEEVEESEIYEFMPNRSLLVQVDKDAQIELDVEEEELTRVPKHVQHEFNATTQTNKEEVEESEMYELISNTSVLVQVDKANQIEIDVDDKGVVQLCYVAQHGMEGTIQLDDKKLERKINGIELEELYKKAILHPKSVDDQNPSFKPLDSSSSTLQLTNIESSELSSSSAKHLDGATYTENTFDREIKQNNLVQMNCAVDVLFNSALDARAKFTQLIPPGRVTLSKSALLTRLQNANVVMENICPEKLTLAAASDLAVLIQSPMEMCTALVKPASPKPYHPTKAVAAEIVAKVNKRPHHKARAVRNKNRCELGDRERVDAATETDDICFNDLAALRSRCGEFEKRNNLKDLHLEHLNKTINILKSQLDKERVEAAATIESRLQKADEEISYLTNKNKKLQNELDDIQEELYRLQRQLRIYQDSPITFHSLKADMENQIRELENKTLDQISPRAHIAVMEYVKREPKEMHNIGQQIDFEMKAKDLEKDDICKGETQMEKIQKAIMEKMQREYLEAKLPEINVLNKNNDTTNDSNCNLEQELTNIDRLPSGRSYKPSSNVSDASSSKRFDGIVLKLYICGMGVLDLDELKVLHAKTCQAAALLKGFQYPTIHSSTYCKTRFRSSSTKPVSRKSKPVKARRSQSLKSECRPYQRKNTIPNYRHILKQQDTVTRNLITFEYEIKAEKSMTRIKDLDELKRNENHKQRVKLREQICPLSAPQSTECYIIEDANRSKCDKKPARGTSPVNKKTRVRKAGTGVYKCSKRLTQLQKNPCGRNGTNDAANNFMPFPIITVFRHSDISEYSDVMTEDSGKTNNFINNIKHHYATSAQNTNFICTNEYVNSSC